MFATAHQTGRHHLTELKSYAAIKADRELRHERWMAVGVFLLFVAMIACILTLAVMSGGSMNIDNGYEYWMMP